MSSVAEKIEAYIGAFLARDDVRVWCAEAQEAERRIGEASAAYDNEAAKGRAFVDELAAKRAELARLKAEEAQAAGEAIHAGEARQPDKRRLAAIRKLEDEIPALEVAIKIQTGKSDAAYGDLVDINASTNGPGVAIVTAWRKDAARDFKDAWADLAAALHRFVLAGFVQDKLLGRGFRLPANAREYTWITDAQAMRHIYVALPHMLQRLVPETGLRFEYMHDTANGVSHLILGGNNDD